MDKNFTTADLETGMLCLTNNNKLYMVALQAASRVDTIKDLLINVETSCWMGLNSYDEDTFEYLDGDSDWDIVKVYKPEYVGDVLDALRVRYPISQFLGNISGLTLVWEKVAPLEMTVAEIEKVLGYPVKIVKEK